MFNRQVIIYDYKSERQLNIGLMGLYSDKKICRLRFRGGKEIKDTVLLTKI